MDSSEGCTEGTEVSGLGATPWLPISLKESAKFPRGAPSSSGFEAGVLVFLVGSTSLFVTFHCMRHLSSVPMDTKY